MRVPQLFRTFLLMLIFFMASQTVEPAAEYKRTIEQYQVPAVTLVNQDGERINLRTFLDADQPVILDFIYGNCTTISPVLSLGFSHFQKTMGEDVDKVRLVSISIDQEK